MSNKPKTVHVDPTRRSPPSPVPPGGRDYPKAGPKTVRVHEYVRSPPSPAPTTPKKK
jgi:hypothetical protein